MKKKFKKLICFSLTGIMLLSCGTTAFADAETKKKSELDKPYIALGADLKADERATVLKELGITEAELKDYDVIEVTNKDEHKYLDEYLSAKIIGTRALSSVLVEQQKDGKGIDVETKNISYCTNGMYRNALITAGVEDAKVKVVGPFEITGTAGLVGAMKAYEVMTGEEVPEENADAAVEELVVTGEVSDSVGGKPADVEKLMAFVKQKMAEEKLETPEQIEGVVKEGAEQLNIKLSDENVNKIVGLMEKIGKLDIDVDTLKNQASDLYEKLSNMDTGGIFDSIAKFFTNIGKSIAKFFSDLF